MVMPSSTSSLTNALKKATSRFMSAVWNQPNPAIAYESLCLVIKKGEIRQKLEDLYGKDVEVYF